MIEKGKYMINMGRKGWLMEWAKRKNNNMDKDFIFLPLILDVIFVSYFIPKVNIYNLLTKI